jgi:hypothetical protein
MMRQPYHDIIPRDDNMFDVVSNGITVAGPFPTWQFAQRVATGNPPEPAPPTPRHFKVIHEVLRHAP